MVSTRRKKMEKNRKVSLWFGNFENENLLEDFIDIEYTEDGDCVPSKFQKYFNIEYYDEDFLEMRYFTEKQNNLQQILKGFSSYDLIISRLEEKYSNISYNSIILLYNFEYSGEIKEYKDFNNNELYYITCVDYE